MSEQQDTDNNMSRKRKSNVYDTTNLINLNLTLGLGRPPPPPPPSSSSYYYFDIPMQQPPPTTTRPPRNRRTHSQTTRQSDDDHTIPPPFIWATDKKAGTHTLDHLRNHHITTITGLVQCKKCENRYELAYNLEEKFHEVGNFIISNKRDMHERAPERWSNPVLPTCRICHAENSVKPVIADKKRNINWLFLLLGEMLGCCTLEQLKYFCKHTNNHRTGAKDRVLYLAYLCVCDQLQPHGPFRR